MSEPTGTEHPEEGQTVSTPEPVIEAMEAVEEAAVEADALAVADAADDYEASATRRMAVMSGVWPALRIMLRGGIRKG